MIGGTCDYGTTGCYRISYGDSTNTSTCGDTYSPTATWTGNEAIVTRTGPGRSRASRDVDVEMPEFEQPVRPVASRTRVRGPDPVVLAPKAAGRSTQVAWTRGRAPKDLSFRTLRLLGKGLRR